GLTWLSERGRDALDLRQYTFVVAQALTRTESGDLAAGRAIADAAVAAAQGNAAVGDLTFARLAQTRALALMGQVPAALETIRQARDDLWSACPHSAMATVLLWAEADALIRAGDHMRAERVVRALPVSESRTMLAARVLGPHQPARVARVMTNLRATSPAVEAHRRLQLAECYVTTDAGLSGSHLVQGARLAHQHGMAMILLDHPRLVELARKLANRDPDVALSQLIAAADGTRTNQMGEVVPVGAPLALSAGELELLRWLPGRQTRADIAEGLGISVNTVKTRMQRLFRKLDVSTRDEAIAAARRRGLLPP
ncbi:MAG: hypothetical protein QG597_1110, partial [Actinomycetota bacterium]|nr:hypothetical protein [Actinomycetota bacterium]